MWPQFGDEVLEETLSLSEGARQSLNKKKECENFTRRTCSTIAWPRERNPRPTGKTHRRPIRLHDLFRVIIRGKTFQYPWKTTKAPQ